MPDPAAFQNPLGTVALTIASGGSFSGSAYLSGAGIVGVANAGTWTAAPLSFQITYDATPPHSGGTWLNAYDLAGEISVPAALLLGTQAISMGVTIPNVQWVRVRSGLLAGGTNQGADRTLVLMVRPL